VRHRRCGHGTAAQPTRLRAWSLPLSRASCATCEFPSGIGVVGRVGWHDAVMRALWRWVRGEGPLWRIGAAIGGMLILAFAIAATVTVLGLHFLHFHAFQPEPLLSAGTLYELLKVAFAVAAGIGGVVALVTAYRRQRVAEFAQLLAQQQHELANRVEERAGQESEQQRALATQAEAREATRLFNERFATAAAQLGDDKPAAVRLAGVYAMAGLADDWAAQRQTCVDVLCAYLRMPYQPDPGDDAPPADRQAFQALREVRHTVIRVIAAHLRPNHPQADTMRDWRGLYLDFDGAQFDGGDFSGAEFSGQVSFAGAEFSSGLLYFGDAEFSGGDISFVRAKFSVGGRVSFARARFTGGQVRFGGTEFNGGLAYFDSAEFSGGDVSFNGAEFSGGQVSFDGAEFSGGHVSFPNALLTGGQVCFNSAEFSGGQVSFSNAEFTGGQICFNGARFSSGRVSFRRAHFAGGTISFNGAWLAGGRVIFDNAGVTGGTVSFARVPFGGGTVSFARTRFTGGEVSFDGAMFTGGTVSFFCAAFAGTEVSFDQAQFTGGTVRFESVASWQVPPRLPPWSLPPVGVTLPPDQEGA
jgi:uncharacterized protein YjbI with pentapeptide repeats